MDTSDEAITEKLPGAAFGLFLAWIANILHYKDIIPKIVPILVEICAGLYISTIIEILLIRTFGQKSENSPPLAVEFGPVLNPKSFSS